MAVNSIGVSLISSAQRVSTGSSQTNAVAAAIAEATETKAATAKEAAHGDPIAKRKLKQIEAKQAQAEADAKAEEPGKGGLVDKGA